MRAWIPIALLLLAGCMQPEAQDPVDDPATPTAAVPVPLTLFVHPDGSLHNSTPDAARQTLDWGYAQWLDGTTPPTWSGPTGPLRILSGNLTLFYEATQPTVSGDVRPELTAWWGTEASIIHHVFMDGPDTLAAGNVVEVTSELRIHEGGLLVSPEQAMELRIGTYYLDGPQLGSMDLLMGGDTPSRLDLIVEPVTWPEPSVERVLETSVELAGGRCVAPLNPEGSAEAFLTVEVPNGSLGLTVRITGTGAPTPDVDLIVTGPAGLDVGGGHGSHGIEGAEVWWPNIDAGGHGTYTIHVFACTPQQATVDITADLWT